MQFDQYAEKYDDGFMGKGSRRFYSDLIRELDIKEGDAVLDIGCGTGSILSYIGHAKQIFGYGLDVSEAMIAIAKEKNPGFHFVVGDCVKLPYEKESMDVVMACMAYHHFSDQEQFRKEVWRILKPGGALYISDPRFPGVVRGIFNHCFQDAGFHSTKRNQADFEHAGFRTVNIRKDMYVQVLHLEKKS